MTNLDPTQRVRAFYRQYAPRYDQHVAWYDRVLLGDGRAWAGAQSRDAVLEVAIGTGRNLPYYPQDRRLTGIDLTDRDIYRRGIEDLSRSYPDADFRPLAVYRIPYGQFAQPPGVHSRLPENGTQTPGLFLAGEYTEDASINGSMLSGEKSAGAVLA